MDLMKFTKSQHSSIEVFEYSNIQVFKYSSKEFTNCEFVYFVITYYLLLRILFIYLEIFMHN